MDELQEYQTCTKCLRRRPLVEFYRDARRPRGRKSSCRQCHSRDVLRRHYLNRGLPLDLMGRIRPRRAKEDKPCAS